MFPEIGVPTNIAVVKPEDMPELVGKGLRRKVARAQGDIMPTGAVRELGACRKHTAVIRESRDVLLEIEMVSA